MLKWKRDEHYRLVSEGGRFRIEGHWDKKPGYYELVDTKTNKWERSKKLKDLKAVAEALVSS
jgi:hypothetical protein